MKIAVVGHGTAGDVSKIVHGCNVSAVLGSYLGPGASYAEKENLPAVTYKGFGQWDCACKDRLTERVLHADALVLLKGTPAWVLRLAKRLGVKVLRP